MTAVIIVLLALFTLSLIPSSVSRGQQRSFSSMYSALHLPVVTDECNGDDYGNSGDFDLYILSQSWSAEFCFPSSHSRYPGCKSPTAWQRVNLTLHGLWPQYTTAQSGHGQLD
jgi:ribonuclease I